MIRRRSSRAGFTLIELMIAVCILGILAAIAIPAFVGYVRRSKTSEATTNLNSLFKSVATYYLSDGTANARGIAAPARVHCLVAGDGPLPAAPGANKQAFSWPAGHAGGFGHSGLGWTISDFVYYSYTIFSPTSICNLPPVFVVYSLRASGDLDGDGTRSTFELSVASDRENSLYHSRGFYIVNETE